MLDYCMTVKVDLEALDQLALFNEKTIHTDMEQYIANVFNIIDGLFDVDATNVVLKDNVVNRNQCRKDELTEYDHPDIRQVKIDRIVRK